MLERAIPGGTPGATPATFTADQVMSLLASFSNEARSLVPRETAEFERLFEDDTVDGSKPEIRPAKREEDSGKQTDKSTRLVKTLLLLGMFDIGVAR